MRSVFVVFYALLTGCTPVIDAQLRLLEQSRQGVARVRTSLDERQRLLESLQSARRRQLDAAFDADVKAQSANAAALTDAWVTQARQAYTAASDGLARQEQASVRAADADRANLDAVDAALAQVVSLNEAQLQFKNPFWSGQ